MRGRSTHQTTASFKSEVDFASRGGRFYVVFYLPDRKKCLRKLELSSHHRTNSY